MTELLTTEAARAEDQRQFLTFELGGEAYGLPILKVQEIKGSAAVTPIPNTPEFIKGAMNLRGTVIPVIDLRERFGIAAAQQGTVTIVVSVAERVVGLIVDGVSDVLGLASEDIAPPPALGGSVDTSFITGLGKCGDTLVLLLDIDALLTADMAAALPPA